MKRISILLFALLILITGCNKSMQELNEYTIVTGLTIQKKDNDIYLTMEAIDLTSSFNNSTTESYLLEGSGKTIEDAIHRCRALTGSDITLSYTRVIIIDDTIPHEELISSISVLKDKYQCKDKATLIKAEIPKNKNILKVATQTTHAIGSYAIFNLFGNYKDQQLSIKDFLSQDGASQEPPIIGITSVLGEDKITILN